MGFLAKELNNIPLILPTVQAFSDRKKSLEIQG
jgi:hypothetical protein